MLKHSIHLAAQADSVARADADGIAQTAKGVPSANTVILNARFSRPRAPLATTLAKRSVALSFGTTRHNDKGWLALSVRIGAHAARLHLPPLFIAWLTAPLATRVAASDDRVALGPLALLLEFAALDLLSALEAMGHGPIRLCEEWDMAHAVTISLSVSVECEGDRFDIGIELPVPLATLLADLLDELAPPAPADPALLPLHLMVETGRVDLAASDIISLMPGDVVMLDHAATMVRVEKGPAAPVRWIKNQLVIGGPFLPSPGHAPLSVGMNRMDAPQDTAWDELPLTMVFEHGRLTMTLGEVRALAPGSSIALPSAAQTRVDLIVNGGRIGVGEIIPMGEGSGVRILSLTDRHQGARRYETTPQ